MNFVMIRANLILLLMFVVLCSYGQKPNAKKIKLFTQERFDTSFEEYLDFLRIPNDGNYPDHIELNLEACKGKFESLGFTTTRINNTGAPQLFASWDLGKETTILFYMQIDGQPVDTSAWDQENPYEPAIKERRDGGWKLVEKETLESGLNMNWRVFARSASDSKGPAMALITALRIMKERKLKPDYNIKVIMDFQEELGSPSLAEAVVNNTELFKADKMLIMDGTRHLSNLPTLNFGARGIATVTLTVHGASRDLHSGQYGNYAPNPVFHLARLLGKMKDEQGRVLIPGFYEGIELTDELRELINDVPEDPVEINASLGIAKPDEVGSTYQESLMYPSLNVRGLRAAWVGKEVRTLIPNKAIAEIDMRLAPETPGQRQVDLMRKFVEEEGYHLIEGEPTQEERVKYDKLITFKYRLGSKAFRTPMDSELGNWLSAAMERVFEDRYVKVSTTGGSQPIAPFITTLNIPAVSIRIPNPDNSIHAPNENLRIGNYLEGIQTCLAILTQPIK